MPRNNGSSWALEVSASDSEHRLPSVRCKTEIPAEGTGNLQLHSSINLSKDDFEFPHRSEVLGLICGESSAAYRASRTMAPGASHLSCTIKSFSRMLGEVATEFENEMRIKTNSQSYMAPAWKSRLNIPITVCCDLDALCCGKRNAFPHHGSGERKGAVALGCGEPGVQAGSQAVCAMSYCQQWPKAKGGIRSSRQQEGLL